MSMVLSSAINTKSVERGVHSSKAVVMRITLLLLPTLLLLLLVTARPPPSVPSQGNVTEKRDWLVTAGANDRVCRENFVYCPHLLCVPAREFKYEGPCPPGSFEITRITPTASASTLGVIYDRKMTPDM